MPVRLGRPTSEDGIPVQAEAEAGEGDRALVPQGAGKVQVAATGPVDSEGADGDLLAAWD